MAAGVKNYKMKVNPRLFFWRYAPVRRTGTFFIQVILFVVYIINEYVISGYLVPAPIT